MRCGDAGWGVLWSNITGFEGVVQGYEVCMYITHSSNGGGNIGVWSLGVDLNNTGVSFHCSNPNATYRVGDCSHRRKEPRWSRWCISHWQLQWVRKGRRLCGIHYFHQWYDSNSLASVWHYSACWPISLPNTATCSRHNMVAGRFASGRPDSVIPILKIFIVVGVHS